jgi:hypothetical protein
MWRLTMSAENQISPEGFHPDFPHGSRSAADVIGKSIYWMRNTRQADAKLIAQGDDPTGPIWSYDPQGNPVYIHRDLITYIRSRYIRAIPVLGSEARPESPLDTGDYPPSAA